MGVATLAIIEHFNVPKDTGLRISADIVNDQLYPAVEKLLGERFITYTFRDITPNVVAGLTQPKEAHKERVRGYVTKGPVAAAISEKLANITDFYIQWYIAGAARYYLWQLLKAID